MVRSREVWKRSAEALQACPAVWQALKAGAVGRAIQQVKEWPAMSTRAVAQGDRLLAYPERSRDQIGSYTRCVRRPHPTGGAVNELSG